MLWGGIRCSLALRAEGGLCWPGFRGTGAGTMTTCRAPRSHSESGLQAHAVSRTLRALPARGRRRPPLAASSDHILSGSRKTPVPAAFQILCVHSLGIIDVSRLKADFRGLSERDAGPPSPVGYKHGRKSVYRPPPGAGALFTGERPRLFP